jgi:hypothetical protein
MGLKETFQNAAEVIVNGFGNVANSLSYHSLGTFSYAPTTGALTESGDSDVTITAIYDEIKSEEIQDRNIKMTDRKLLVANNDISVTPKVNDYVTIDGVQYNVVDFISDPAEALYEIYVRRT